MILSYISPLLVLGIISLHPNFSNGKRSDCINCIKLASLWCIDEVQCVKKIQDCRSRYVALSKSDCERISIPGVERVPTSFFTPGIVPISRVSTPAMFLKKAESDSSNVDKVEEAVIPKNVTEGNAERCECGNEEAFIIGTGAGVLLSAFTTGIIFLCSRKT